MRDKIVNEGIGSFADSCAHGENGKQVIVEEIIGAYCDGENGFLGDKFFCLFTTKQFVDFLPSYVEVINLDIH